MKKILVLLLVLSLTTLCACKNAAIDDLPDDVTDPANVTDSGAAGSGENEAIDWETPIDIDDAFQQEIEDQIDTTEGDVTDPAVEDEPTADETTAAQNTPTQPNATEPAPTQPAPTDPVETTRPNNGSRPIELPMIPG